MPSGRSAADVLERSEAERAPRFVECDLRHRRDVGRVQRESDHVATSPPERPELSFG